MTTLAESEERDGGNTRSSSSTPTDQKASDESQSQPNSSFEGKVAIVTGSAGGIGRAIAEYLADLGARVVIADINGEAAQQTATAIGPQALPVTCNVADLDNINRMVRETIEHYGRIDVLVNNAGVAHLEPDNFLHTKEKDWDWVMSVDLKGLFFCTQAVAHEMVKRRSGNIIHISSQSSLSYSRWQGPHYHAAKAAVNHLTRIMAIEMAPFGVRVNCVSPSAVLTPVVRKNFVDDQKTSEWLLKQIPIGRMCEPRELAAAIAFLASDQASYITGQILPVNGGVLAFAHWD